MPACDLCGAVESRVLATPATPRAMQSDRTIVPTSLAKVECMVCGLVRDADPHGRHDDYYTSAYRLDRGDHVFYTASGPMVRSALLADWVERLLAQGVVDPSRARVLEVGASRGFLVTELATRWPRATVRGIELGVAAAAEAVARGAAVVTGETSQLPAGEQDIVIAVAVLEHVPSPSAFLGELARLIRPGGHLVLIQPTQDVPSYDVFFVDHLFHFGTPHIEALASQRGFRTRWTDVGFDFMPNFSGHLCEADGERSPRTWSGPPAATTCAATLRSVMADLSRAVRRAAELRAAGRLFGVFGLHEVFALVQAYSSLAELGITVGLTDDPGNPEYSDLGCPVARPEDCAAYGVRDVFLTMNRVHYPHAIRRLAALGVHALPVLTEHQKEPA